MTHELDNVYWMGEPDVVDPDDPTGNVDHVLLRFFNDWKDETGAHFTTEDKMLGLASGQAFPELKLAESLGIPYSNVTLLDRAFSWEAMLRFQTSYPDVQTYESGMFAFLESYSGDQKYKLVTAIGVEYSLKTRDAINKFASLLPNVMQPEGLVVVFPYPVKNTEEYWRAHEFENIFPWMTTHIAMYQYKPASRAILSL